MCLRPILWCFVVFPIFNPNLGYLGTIQYHHWIQHKISHFILVRHSYYHDILTLLTHNTINEVSLNPIFG